ncbi:MAG: diacylglycerol kinase [Deltaproteobacteria bacterium]|jgi:diacylglycerol kinase (ATP)|nr:diacylglycerol kinase [Deltaproteobacteria bacterium]
MDDKMSGIEHVIGATRYSLQGLRRAWHEEQAFRHEGVVLGILFLLLVLTEKSLHLMLLTLGGWLFVMSIELLNSAIENAFNLIGQEPNDRIKAGKDMASAAIFLAIAANVGLWIFVFFG